MRMKKINCWEFKKCGRELGGMNSLIMQVCPAATDVLLDGVHGGSNAGRACWIIAGTLSGDQSHCGFANTFASCGCCDFYEFVKNEEGENLQMTHSLLKLVE